MIQHLYAFCLMLLSISLLASASDVAGMSGSSAGVSGPDSAPLDNAELQKMTNPAAFVREQLTNDFEREDYVEVEQSDGAIKRQKVGDILDRLDRQEQTMGSMKNKDGNLVSEDGGTVTMDDIMNKKEHGQLKKFIMLGRWAHQILKSQGVAAGEITNVESSPRYSAGNTGRAGVDSMGNQALPNLILLSVKSESGDVSKFEVQMEIDEKYVKPHAVAVEAWHVDASGERGESIGLPEPVRRPMVMGYYAEDLAEQGWKLGVAMVAIGGATFAYGVWSERK